MNTISNGTQTANPNREKGDRAPMEERFMRITQELAALRGMTVKQLNDRYLELYGRPAHTNNKAYLQKRLSYRVQEIAEGNGFVFFGLNRKR